MDKKKVVIYSLLLSLMSFFAGINIMNGNIIGLVFTVIAMFWDLYMVIDTLYISIEE